MITVAIHTYEKAIALKALLEREGLTVTLQNVNLEHPVISAGVRVRIHESDLPMALRIIENQELFSDAKDTDSSVPYILVPVDFSECSNKACDIAFNLAQLHKARIVLLHSYINPVTFNRIQLSDMLSFDDSAIEDEDNRLLLQDEASRQMDIFSNTIRERIKSGDIPAVMFSTEILEGLPEESINQYAKDNKPLLIVMGTRGADTKGREMVGSVTAEVLDTCRFPVFTVPETIEVKNIDAFDNILFFSNFDQEDILALDALFNLLPVEGLNVVLVNIPSKKQTQDTVDKSLKQLETYCRKHYPIHQFTIDSLSISSIDDDFHRISDGLSGKLIAVPNKKKNILARLFNPGIAHKILFHSDTPMIVVPV